MPEERQETVDGFSDNKTDEKLSPDGERAGTPGSPDPGMEGERQPLSAEEYARLKKEAGEEDTNTREGR